MIRVDVEQGSPQWHACRVGIATMSNGARILTPKTRKPSSQQAAYCAELVSERLTGRPVDPIDSTWMQRGKEMESDAVAYYEFEKDVECETVGFVIGDSMDYGCSPDRLVGEDGGLEIKCPSAKNHVSYALNGIDSKYLAQVHGCMWLCDRKWWDILSYNPLIEPTIERIERDEEYIQSLCGALALFLERLDEACKKMNVPDDWRNNIHIPDEGDSNGNSYEDSQDGC